MRTTLPAVLLLLIASVSVSASEGYSLSVTTNLLRAKAGSWQRSHRTGPNTYTEYVAETTGDTVTLLILHKKRDHYSSSRRVRIPVSYITEHGVSADAPDAREEALEFRGETYRVKVVRTRSPGDDADVEYFFSDRLPVSGVLRKDVFPDNGPARVSFSFDEYGTEPDAEITKGVKALDPVDANADFGIPEP